MKTKITLNLLFLGLFTLAAAASDTEKSTYYSPSQMSEEVKAVVQNKCFGCHNTDSKNDKAKEDLDFKTFDTLTNLKKVSAYKKIGDVVNENEMPPKKFLEHYPDKKLTDAEKKLLMDWAKAEAEKLVKGM